MAQILVIGSIFRWGLTSNVGRNSPNLFDDVELVRFGYFCMSINAKFPPNPALVDPLSRMFSVGPYGSDLQDVIDAHEQDRGGTQDGHVSVEKVGPAFSRERYDGKTTFIMAILGNHMLDITNDFFPRIDRHPMCGSQITATVKKVFHVK